MSCTNVSCKELYQATIDLSDDMECRKDHGSKAPSVRYEYMMLRVMISIHQIDAVKESTKPDTVINVLMLPLHTLLKLHSLLISRIQDQIMR